MDGIGEWMWQGMLWLWENFLLGLLIAIVILIVGYVVAWGVKYVMIKALRKARIDDYFKDTGLTESLQGVGFRGIPDLIGLLMFWFIFLFFIATALGYLNFPEVTEFVGIITLYLPRIIGAVLIILGGLWLGTWAASRVKEPAKEVDLPITSETLGSIVKWLVVFITVVLALGMLGIDTTILVTTFVILIGAIALALAISFGLGGRETAANVSAFAAVDKIITVGDEVSIGDHRGTVLLVGRYATVLKTEKGERVTLPNKMVMESVIVKAAAK
jgi:small-conductance mechanosensitive channel